MKRKERAAVFRPHVRLRIRHGVCPRIANVCKRLARVVPLISPPHHPVDIIVHPAGRVHDDALGTFCERTDGSRAVIELAGRINGVSGSRLAEEVMLTFLHEWAHYEQFRDRGETTERGIEVRVRSMLRALRNLEKDVALLP